MNPGRLLTNVLAANPKKSEQQKGMKSERIEIFYDSQPTKRIVGVKNDFMLTFNGRRSVRFSDTREIMNRLVIKVKLISRPLSGKKNN